MRRTLRIAPMAVLAAIAASAGDLSPPAGPVSPTMKTLSQVEPRIALNSVNTPGDANSILRISSPGSYYLCADLVGSPGKFGIEVAADDVTIDLNGFCLVGVPSSSSGIGADNTTRHRIRIHNGSIVGWGAHGIAFELGTSSGVQLDHLRLRGNGQSGVSLARDSNISQCVAEENGGYGFSVYYGSTFTECVATGNGYFGIHALSAGVIRGCVARGNLGGGIRGFQGVLIEGCVAAANQLNGIEPGYDCTVRNNNCSNNGLDTIGAGIFVGPLYRGNRIEDNQMSGNDYGLKVDGDNNFIVRNTARNNASGDFTVVSGNELAPVVSNPGSNNFNSALYWSNFSY